MWEEAGPTEQEKPAETAVRQWRKIRRRPHSDGIRRRDRVRKMQPEAAPNRM
jgi:hypothetical protein